jgi:hypothetical protein
MAIRLRYTINTHLEGQGVIVPTAIGASTGLPAVKGIGRVIPARLAVDTPSRGGKAVAHQRSAGSGVCQPFGGLVLPYASWPPHLAKPLGNRALSSVAG